MGKSKANKINDSNPFNVDSCIPRKPIVHNPKERAKTLKQIFSVDKVPENLDAIVIGSGIGALSAAAIMSKAHKRVLVLEQHDQAGGCCHTYTKNGYEFDVGVHYVGEMGNKQSLNKTLFDQISNGQIEWTPLDHNFDIVQIGNGETGRTYPVAGGFDAWKNQLLKQFPNEKDHEAIHKYFELLKHASNNNFLMGVSKVLPMLLVKMLLHSGILKFFTSIYRPEYQKPAQQTIEELTDNKDLQTVLLYCWGAYGTPADQTNFTMFSMLQRHFLEEGAFYPRGGGSEIPF